MKKKTLSLFLGVALFAMSLAACGKDDTPIRSEENLPPVTSTDKAETPDINNEEITETPVIPDIIKNGDDEKQEDNTDKDEKNEKPDIDFLYTAPEGYESFEIVETFNGSQYSFFTTETTDGPRYGIINMSGEIVVQPTYTLLGYCDWHDVIYADLVEGDEPIVLDEKYKIDLHYGHGGTMPTYYVFDKAAGKMFTYTFNYDCFETREVTTIAMLTPYVVYNGAERILPDSYYSIETDGQVYQTLVEYALGYNEYEFPDGKITDGAECEFISDIGSIVNLGKLDYVPHAGFVNDYMVISRGGKLGFVNGIGKDSTPTVFENASQAYDNRAWVKYGGVWGIIGLE